MIPYRSLQQLSRRPSKSFKRGASIRFATSKAPDPLRILFCGSDAFSSTSLEALNSLRQTAPTLIKSIDVLCRPPKRTGRGLKTYREVPVALAARQLGLPLHQIDTFRGWTLPKHDPADKHIDQADGTINLVIAVSFGLLVPSRILNNAKFGGLNVHPSLLPDFRGAAPIEHALLAGCTRTGVTLQTLHPTRMDHGQILLQWPKTGFEIPKPDSVTPAELKELLAPIGAMMLTHAIRERLYVPPIQPVTPLLQKEQLSNLRIAPKILPEDHRIRWQEWTADEILRRQQVLGSLWNIITIDGQEIRLTFPVQFTSMNGKPDENIPPGVLMYCQGGGPNTSAIWCKTIDGKFLCFDRIKVAGFGELAANVWARKARLFVPSDAKDIELGSYGTFTLAPSKLE